MSPSFSFDAFNDLLKRVLQGRVTFCPPEDEAYCTRRGIEKIPEENVVACAYTDFINVFCLLNGVRNGVHLDCFPSANAIQFVRDDEAGYSGSCDDYKYIQRLLTELTRMGLQGECPEFKYSQRYEITIWDPAKVPNNVALHSWAFEGDCGRTLEDPYWKNNAILLGNHLGYPTLLDYSFMAEENAHPDHGVWSLTLTFHLNGDALDYMSLCGGSYNAGNPSDLDSIRYIRDFLLQYVGKPMYNPDDKKVILHDVEIRTAKTITDLHAM